MVFERDRSNYLQRVIPQSLQTDPDGEYQKNGRPLFSNSNGWLTPFWGSPFTPPIGQWVARVLVRAFIRYVL